MSAASITHGTRGSFVFAIRSRSESLVDHVARTLTHSERLHQPPAVCLLRVLVQDRARSSRRSPHIRWIGVFVRGSGSRLSTLFELVCSGSNGMCYKEQNSHVPALCHVDANEDGSNLGSATPLSVPPLPSTDAKHEC